MADNGRIATAQDTIDFHMAREGIDYINEGRGDGLGLQLDKTEQIFRDLPTGARIILDCSGSSSVGGVWNAALMRVQNTHDGGSQWNTNDPNNPRIFTNARGKFRVNGGGSYNIEFLDADQFRLTGKYEEGVSGAINFKGHDDGYAFSRGKYGIEVDDAWRPDGGFQAIHCDNNANNYEIDYIQTGDGTFANSLNNTVNPPQEPFPYVDPVYQKVHDIYSRDHDGEAFYLGSTKGQKQARIQTHVYRNRIIRPGSEAIQINQAIDGSIIENNVVVGAALKWKIPFQSGQDGNSQVRFRNGGVIFRNNIIIAGGATIFFLGKNEWLNIEDDDSDGITAFDVYNNLYYFPKHHGMFISAAQASDPAKRTPVNFNENWLGQIVNRYGEILVDGGDEDYWCLNYNTDVPYTYTNNKIDPSYTGGLLSGGANPNEDESGTSVEVILPPQFTNSGWPIDVRYDDWERWGQLVGYNEYGRNEMSQVGYRHYPSKYTGSLDFGSQIVITLVELTTEIITGAGTGDPGVQDYTKYKDANTLIKRQFRIGKLASMETDFAICEMTAWNNSTKQATFAIATETYGDLTGSTDWAIDKAQSFITFFEGQVVLDYSLHYEYTGTNKQLSWNVTRPAADVSGQPIDENGFKNGTYWKQKHWWDGSGWNEYPPDDYTNVVGSKYDLLNIGLQSSNALALNLGLKSLLYL